MGGAKKAKQKAKAKEEPRDSIFRHLFRSLKVGDSLPPELADMMGRGGDDDDDDDMPDDDKIQLMMILEQGHELLREVEQAIVPYAVRYYTGEAGADSDDDDEESEEEDEDDDDDDEDDSEDEPPRRGGPKNKP